MDGRAGGRKGCCVSFLLDYFLPSFPVVCSCKRVTERKLSSLPPSLLILPPPFSSYSLAVVIPLLLSSASFPLRAEAGGHAAQQRHALCRSASIHAPHRKGGVRVLGRESKGGGGGVKTVRCVRTCPVFVRRFTKIPQSFRAFFSCSTTES